MVSWSEEGENAEHPAPVLYVNAEAPSGHHGAAPEDEAETAGSQTPAAASDTTPAPTQDVLARVLGIAGLVVGAIGVAFGITARRRPASK